MGLLGKPVDVISVYSKNVTPIFTCDKVDTNLMKTLTDKISVDRIIGGDILSKSFGIQ